MRVLHLSTGASGGAAIAGQRIHLAMRGAGIDSLFASRGPAIGIDSEFVVRLSGLDRIRSSAITGIDRLAARDTASFFSPVSGSFVDRGWLRAMAPDVLVVHNWFNLLGSSRRGFLSDAGLPMLFVLHDERMFTGGCHQAGECRGFESVCAHCPQAQPCARRLVRREQLATPARIWAPNTIVVAPSEWLARQADLSATLRGMRIHHIPNPIDTNVFRPSLRHEARQAFGLDADELVIAWQPGKGDEMLAPVMRLVQDVLPRGVRLRLLQSGTASGSASVPTIVAGTLKTEPERARFWAAADIAFSLTAFDNFPNIVLEAMACGVPFVMPDVGGAGEAIRATGGGAVVARRPEAIADHLLALINSSAARGAAAAAARAGVLREYGYQFTASRYAQLLDSIA